MFWKYNFVEGIISSVIFCYLVSKFNVLLKKRSLVDMQTKVENHHAYCLGHCNGFIASLLRSRPCLYRAQYNQIYYTKYNSFRFHWINNSE